MINHEEYAAYLLGTCVLNLREGKRFSAGVNWSESLEVIRNIKSVEVKERAFKLHYAIS